MDRNSPKHTSRADDTGLNYGGIGLGELSDFRSDAQNICCTSTLLSKSRPSRPELLRDIKDRRHFRSIASRPFSFALPIVALTAAEGFEASSASWRAPSPRFAVL